MIIPVRYQSAHPHLCPPSVLSGRAYGGCPASGREREPTQHEYVREHVDLVLALSVRAGDVDRCGCVDACVSPPREGVRVNAVHCIPARHRVS